jgi:hypothetical protein
MEYILAALLLSLLGTAHVMGFDFVKKHSPAHLPQFCLAMTVIRLVLVGTLAGIVILLKENREDAMMFAIIYLIMYAITVVISLWLRH